jgi:hypothetical protein
MFQPGRVIRAPNSDTYIVTDSYPGLTKREYFAAMALQGILANSFALEQANKNWGGIESPQQAAVKAADALIEQLNKEK